MNETLSGMGRSRRRMAACLALAVWVQPARAVIAPVLTAVRFEHNKCSEWDAYATFRASELPDGDAAIVENYAAAGYGHLHDERGSFYYDTTNVKMRGDWRNRVQQINEYIFKSGVPVEGQTTVIYQGHDGSCAAQDGGFECVGILLGEDGRNTWDPKNGKPPNLGGCFRVPPASGSCWFASPEKSVNLGVVSGGDNQGTGTEIQYACDGQPPAYRVSLVGGGSSVTDAGMGVSVEIKIGGGNLPYRLTDTGPGTRNLEVDLYPKAEAGATGDFRAHGVLELAPE